jgi:putative PIN family toxin of toxin-antitoxin system
MKTAPAVIDTNVVVSGLLTSLAASPTARIVDGMLAGQFRYLLSIELLAEYRSVLLRPKIRRRHGLSPAEIDVFLTEIAANGAALEIGGPVRGAGRRGDDHLWRILEAVPSAVLVSGDRRLIEKPARGARVLTPRGFAESIGDQGR